MSEPARPPDPIHVAATPPGAARDGGPNGVGAGPEPGAAGSEQTHFRSANLAVPSVVGAAAEKFKHYKHVPLQCPNCGFEGRAKIVQLGGTFYCKQCGKNFHVTVQGTVRGTRPPEERRAPEGAVIALEKPNWLERSFSRLPRLGRWAAWAVLVLAIGGGATFWLQSQREASLPSDLQKRAELAGSAFAQGNWQLLDRMAMPEGSQALHDWYEKVRPQELAELTSKPDVRVTIGTMTRLYRTLERVEGKNEKVPVADFRTPLDIDVYETREGPLRFHLDLVWVKKDGEWRIDGEWAREFSQPAKSAAPPRPAPEQVAGKTLTDGGDGADGAGSDATAPPGSARPKTALERKQMREARFADQPPQPTAAAQQRAEPARALPLSPAQRRRREN
jgi:hypothetical protein